MIMLTELMILSFMSGGGDDDTTPVPVVDVLDMDYQIPTYGTDDGTDDGIDMGIDDGTDGETDGGTDDDFGFMSSGGDDDTTPVPVVDGADMDYQIPTDGTDDGIDMGIDDGTDGGVDSGSK